MRTSDPTLRAVFFEDAAALIGLVIAFVGILLHQILQWHHLLSLVPGIGDLRAQVMWDGVFHALMYVIAAAGLVALWRAHRRDRRRRASAHGRSRRPRRASRTRRPV